jgi:hypothetical protein
MGAYFIWGQDGSILKQSRTGEFPERDTFFLQRIAEWTHITYIDKICGLDTIQEVTLL